MSYEPYSGGGYQPFLGDQAGGPPERMEPPSSVLNAVKVMYAGGAISAIAAIIGLTAVGSERANFQRQVNPVLTASQVNLHVVAFIVGVVVVGLIGMGLWIWMAVKSKAGRNWARITSTVFFGIYSIILLVSIQSPGTVPSRLVTILGWVTGLAAIILLWQKQSGEYFRSQSELY
jgi:uncharacterized membrane protein YidH (DUF202 family)